MLLNNTYTIYLTNFTLYSYKIIISYFIMHRVGLRLVVLIILTNVVSYLIKFKYIFVVIYATYTLLYFLKTIKFNIVMCLNLIE